MIRIIGAGARPGQTLTEVDTFWTVPNLITVLRFLGIPLFVWLVATDRYGGAFLTLVVVAGTDWVDGYLARRLNQVSTVGKWLDPAADRLAMLIVAVTFVADGLAPIWLVYAILIPDLILLVNSLLLFRGSPNLKVSNVGKIRTALLLVGSPLLLLTRVPGFDQQWLTVLADVFLVLGCIGHVAAFSAYMAASWRKYRAEQASGTG